MNAVYLFAVSALLLSLLVGFFRVWRGPTPADRMLAAQLFGTTGVAILLLLAEWQQQPPFRDVALVLVTLAALGGAGFVGRAWTPRSPEPEHEPRLDAAAEPGEVDG